MVIPLMKVQGFWAKMSHHYQQKPLLINKTVYFSWILVAPLKIRINLLNNLINKTL